MALLAYTHCNFHPEVEDYLMKRHRNVAELEEPPACRVTTGLLVALHYTAHGKNDVLDCVIEMDTHQWITVPDMASEEEQAAAVKRCRSTLHSRIKDRLEKVIGSGGKDRKQMALKDSDPADTSNCLNCLLCEKYVSMPEKKKKRKRNSSSTATSTTTTTTTTTSSSSSSSFSSLAVSSSNASSTASDTDSSAAVSAARSPGGGMCQVSSAEV